MDSPNTLAHNMAQNEYPGTYPPPPASQHALAGRIWDYFKKTPQEERDEEDQLQAQQGKFDFLSKWVFYLIDNNKTLQSIQTTHEQRIVALEQQPLPQQALTPPPPPTDGERFAWTPGTNGETYHDFDPAIIPTVLDRLVKRTDFRAKQTDYHAYQIETLMKSHDALQQRVAVLEQHLLSAKMSR